MSDNKNTSLFNLDSNNPDELVTIGLICAHKRSYDESIKYIEKAQKLYYEAKNTEKIVCCLAELALLHYKKCNDRLIRSLTLLNDAKYLIDNVENKDKITAKITHYYGIIYYAEKRYSEALKSYKKALKLCEKDTLEHACILDDICVFYLRINNQPAANRYIKESISIKAKLDNKLELAKTYLIFGRHLLNIENYEEAEQYLVHALEITQNYKDFFCSSRITDEIAKIYTALNQLDKAEHYARMSMELSSGKDNELAYAFSCCTTANILNKKALPEESLSVIDAKVENTFMRHSSARGYALLKKVRAQSYDLLNDFENSIMNMHEAVELYSEAGANTEVARCYHEMSVIYYKSSDISMALSSSLEALRVAKQNELPTLIKTIEDFLFEIDEDEWANFINKSARKEQVYTEVKPVLDTLNLINDIPIIENSSREALLALLRIGRAIAAETDLNNLLEIIAEETKKALGADRCTVFLLDKDTNELWSKVALGMGSQEIRFPAHMGLAGHVAMTGETINIKDAYNDDRFNKEIDKKTGYTTKTILCMPMRNLSHEIIGVFQVLNKLKDGVFRDEDEDLLIAIGSSAGIALENARLFKKQQIMYEEQKKSFNSFINTLAASVDARDKITAGHSKRVTEYTVAIAQQMKMNQDEVDQLEYAALLHDFGKIGIRDSVLQKEGKLTDEEYKHIQEHVFITNEILKTMYFEEKYKQVPEIASSHHEKFNGCGYFRKLQGDEIPLGGRILAVSDVFDAITSKRHYRDRMPFMMALNIMRKDSGTHFDPAIIKEFFDVRVGTILGILMADREDGPSIQETEFLDNFSLQQFYDMLAREAEQRTELENSVIESFEKYYNSKEGDKTV